MVRMHWEKCEITYIIESSYTQTKIYKQQHTNNESNSIWETRKDILIQSIDSIIYFSIAVIIIYHNILLFKDKKQQQQQQHCLAYVAKYKISNAVVFS